MKSFIGLQVLPMKDGRWKAYLWGAHRRFVSIEGQPRAGFYSSEIASAWVRHRFASKQDALTLSRTVGGGTRLDDALIERGRIVALPELPAAVVVIGTITLDVCGVRLTGIHCPTCKTPIDQSWSWTPPTAAAKSVKALCPHCEQDCRVEFALKATVVSVTPVGVAPGAKKARRP